MKHLTNFASLMLLAVICLLPQMVEAAGFNPTGGMSTGRYHHSVTLLNNGKVLIVGGYNNGNAIGSAELYDPATGQCTPTGNLSTARYGHTATMLANGKVLIAGGYNTTFLGSAELYDPATGTFSTEGVGSMVTARNGHTATLLKNGKVLIAAGSNGSVLAAAELFDPASNTFTATRSLVTARSNPAAVLLQDGKVLVAGGGLGSDNVINTAELYDPVTGKFSATGSMGKLRLSAPAIVLPSGKVLIAGGYSGSGLYQNDAELYDPALGTFSYTAGGMSTPRETHTANLLPNGKVLIVGGDNSGGFLNSAELYDPASNSFSSAGSLYYGNRRIHNSVLLPGGQVLICGGNNGPALASNELYDYAAGSFSATGAMGSARYAHTATPLQNGKVLVTGGHDGSSYLNSAELYDPVTGVFTATGDMGNAKGYHTATLLPSGKVLITGGWNGSSYLNSAELYDPATGSFTAIGSTRNARSWHIATLLPSGKVLITGGYGGGSYLSSAELYDPATGSFTATGSMGSARRSHTATLLPNGKVLIAGGWNSSSTLNSAELYDPVTGSFSATGSMGSARRDHTATLLHGGNVLITGGVSGSSYPSSAELYDPATGSFSTTGSTGSARYWHIATILPSGNVLITGGWNGSSTLNGAELYDPSTGNFSATGGMLTGRYNHSFTLLNNGKVLIAGGYSSNSLNSAELYDPGLGFSEARRPIISGTMSGGTDLILLGSGFFGDSEGGGSGHSSFATNYPLVKLQRIDNGQTSFIRPYAPMQDNYFGASLFGLGLPSGHYLTTVITNAIPSVSYIRQISPLFSVNQTTLDFGSVETEFSYTLPVTIHNSGAAELYLTATISGSDAAMFLVAGSTCGSTLPAGLSCTISVSFAPTTAGGKSATLTVTSNDPDNPVKTVALSGNGYVPTHQLALSFSPLTTGSGDINYSTGGSCSSSGSGCSSSFDKHTQVTLSPSPLYGSFFAGWALDCSGRGDCTLTMDGNRSAEATFTSFTPLPMGSTSYNELGWFGSTGDIPLAGSNHDLQAGDFHSFGTAESRLVMYDITTSITGNGTVVCQTPIEHGFSTSCTVTPAQFNRVISVTGCNGSWSGSNPYVTGAITANCTVAAQFADNTAPVTTPSVPGGTYTSAQSVSLSCQDFGGSGCSGTWYCTGSGCTPTTPYGGAISIGSSQILRFYSADTSGNNEGIQQTDYTIQSTFNLGVTIAGSGNVRSMPTTEVNCSSGTCNQLITGGNLVTLVPKAASGFYFASWSGCDSVTGNVCNVTMNAAKSITASFIAYPAGTIAVAAGVDGSLALKNDGTVWGFGRDSIGLHYTPAQVTGLSGAIAIADGYMHSIALMADGKVKSWGVGSSGQLGNGTSSTVSTPVLAITPEGMVVQTIAAGANHNLALMNDGTVRAWGLNNYGQLGDSSTINKDTPTQVVGPGGTGWLTGVVAIAAGDSHSMALKSDGTVWAWGSEEHGRLGNNVGTATARRTPVQVTSDSSGTPLTDIIAISCGQLHSLALRRDGTVWAWGKSDNGQLGTGTWGTQSGYAVQVLTAPGTPLTGITSIAAGGVHSLALKANGTVMGWGGNYNGQVGDNMAWTKEVYAVPVSTITGITAIAAGGLHSLALKADGTIWAWGENGDGQLGDATTTDRTTPVRSNPPAPCNVLAGNALVGYVCYTTISAAYANAASGDMIKALSTAYAESLNANRAINVTVQGGYADANFQSRMTTHSSVNGFTITSGSLIADQFTIR